MTRRRHKTSRNEQAPGWVWMLFGLGLGLVVAAGVYLSGRDDAPSASADAPAAASDSPGEPAAAGPPAAAAREPASAEADESRFSFYEMLPQFEVVIPEVEAEAGRGVRSRPVEEPGRYVLQAGSFRALADADRRQANIALLGIESRIQRVTIDDDVFHRVRIGPITDLDELNRTRRRLRDAGVETMLMKVPD